MERSMSHHLYMAHFSYHTFSCPYTSRLCTMAYVFATLIWIPTTLAVFLSYKSPGTSFFSLLCQHHAPASIWENESSHLQSLSWPRSSVLLKYMARLHTCSFYVAHPTETLHSNAHDFFFWNQASCSVFTMIGRYLMQKKKGKRKGKKNNEKQWQEHPANQ